MLVHLGFAVVLAAFLACSAQAQTPEGEEFQINTYTSCNQDSVEGTSLVDGGFVIVWESGSAAYQQDGSYVGVFGQRFDAEGARAGTEFQINVYTTDYQNLPSVARRTDGGFVVVWSSYEQPGDEYYGVRGRKYTAAGAPDGGEFQVNTYTASDQYYADIAPTPDGFVVVWDSHTQDGSEEGIFGQRLDPAGAKLGTEFPVNTYTTAHQRAPQVAADADGRFVVVWHSFPVGAAQGQDGSSFGVFAQRFAADGQRAGTEFQVNVYTTEGQAGPDVAAAENGRFLVVWEGRQALSNPPTDEVMARLYGADGAPLGGEFRVNSYSTAFEEGVSVSVAPNGSFVVAWETENGGVVGNDDSQESVIARRVSADGAPLGDEFQVNTYSNNDQDDPAAVVLANGDFVVAWESSIQDGDLSGIFGQLFASDVTCADANGDGAVSASDALIALKTAVGSASCLACVCDVDSSGSVSATDALVVLRAAVGQAVSLECAACG